MSVEILNENLVNLYLENALEALAQIQENENLFLSVYFKTDKLKNNLQVTVQKILQLHSNFGKEQRKEILSLIKHLEVVCSDYTNRKDYSLACFIRGGDEPVVIVVEVPGELTNEVHLSTLPSIFSLVEKKDQYHRYAIVYLTSVSARIIQVNAGRITQNLLTGSLDLRSKVSREISRERYINHQQERGVKFYREKIEIIESIVRDNGLDHIILAGEPRFISQFKSLLPEYLNQKVIDETISGNIDSFESVLKASIVAFVKQEEKESKQAMEKLRYALATDGLAISGYEEVREALRNHRLDKLIISKECPKTLADPILKEAVLKNILIETVDDEFLLEQLDGFAGFVRYKLYV